MRRSGITLIELLVVVAIVAIIAAIVYPVVMRAKKSAKQSACISNLRQIGSAIGLYMNDYDDKWPLGLDPADKYTPQIWNAFPEFQSRIPSLPLMNDLLMAYLPSRSIWECPADKGTEIDDVSFEYLDTTPSSFRKYGSSYYYRTELTVRSLSGTGIPNLTEINVYFDGSGAWHTGEELLRRTESASEWMKKLNKYRYNTLFGDLHAKNIPWSQYQAAWDLPL